MKVLKWFSIVSAAIIVLVYFFLKIQFSGNMYLKDPSTKPTMPESALELVIDTDLPPGNIAVSKMGRVFFTYHPEAKPEKNLAEIVKGKAVAYPSDDFQTKRKSKPYFTTVLSIRVDELERLWTLDHGNYGTDNPRLYAFDLKTNKLVYEHVFASSVVPAGSLLNDFQVDLKEGKIYITDQSAFAAKPALIVYDIAKKKARRLLEKDRSVTAMKYIIKVGADEIGIAGIKMTIAADSIALDREAGMLFYGPLCGDRLFRIKTKYLNDPNLTKERLASKVEVYAAKSLSDGITMDSKNNIYLADPGHSAIQVIGRDQKLKTLIRSAKLRWADGFSFGPDNWIYVTCSSLQHVILKPKSEIPKYAPYQIYRFKALAPGVPGR
jgi:sugar lactone lactonase YvrE